MLQFRGNSTPRTASGRQDRRRLLLLLFGLGIAVMLIHRMSTPSFWRWFDSVASPGADAVGGDAIDNRLDAVAQKNSTSDAFIIAKEKKPDDSDARDGYFPGVRPSDFSTIRDDSLSTRGELACTLRLLDILNRTNNDELNRASTGPVAYAQLFRQPNQYRGRLVTLSGTVRRVNRIEILPNEYGIKAYYQVWLYPSDNPTAPVVLYCLDLPKGFPTGMTLAEEAEATGFFFKRWAYQAKDALRTAPTVLAKTLQWQRRPMMTQEPGVDAWMIPVVLCGAVLLALLFAGYVYLRTRPKAMNLPDRLPHFELPRDSDDRGAS